MHGWSDDWGGGEAGGGIFALEEYADRLAIITADGQNLSYQMLADRADEIARGFGDDRALVLIEAANNIEPLLAYIGAMRAGHAVLLVPRDMPPDRRAALIETYRPCAGFGQRDGAWSSWYTGALSPTLHPELSLLLSTSGSTGAAKLVRLSRSALEANAASIERYLAIDRSDRAATTLPFHYSYGLSVVHSHLRAGATLLLTDASVIDPAFRQFIVAGEVTSLAGVPYTYELLERCGFRDSPPPTLRTLTQAGGRLSTDIALRYAAWSADSGVRFFVMYGQTEATARMAYMPPDLLAAHPDHIGVAIPGGSFALVDDNGDELADDARVGELLYRGPNVMMGYALDADHLARGCDLTELRTGDLAMRNAAGLYRIVGRKSRFIKPFGVRIGLDEVEELLARRGLTGVATGDDSLLAIVLVGATPERVAREADAVADALALPLSALNVASVTELPLLSSGKTDYAAILAAAVAQRSCEASDPSTGRDISALFVEAFPRAQVREDASFTSLGGDSLNYVTLSAGLERLIGRLPVNWENLSLATLQNMVPADPPVGRRWWQVRWIETEVLVRSLAILAIVITHASDKWQVGGGANVLLLLFGYNLSRYQFPRLVTGGALAMLSGFTLRIMLPYYLFLTAWMAAKQITDIPSLLLISNYTGRFGSLMEPFWFLETTFQTMIFITAAMMSANVRSVVIRRPWETGLISLLLGLVGALVLNTLVPRPQLAFRTPELLFWLVGLGWSMHRATLSRRRTILLTVIVLVVAIGFMHPFGLDLGYPNSASQRVWFAISCVAIMFVPRLPVPGIAAVVFTTLAAASFYIYLTHVVPIHLLRHVMHVEGQLLIIILAIAPGVALWWLLQWRQFHVASARRI